MGNWFAHPEDSTVRDLEELEEIFRISTANDNCLLLNIPPGTDGKQNPQAIRRINELASFLGIENGAPFPENPPRMMSLTEQAVAQANGILNNDTLHHGPQYAIDSDVSTAWTGDSLSTLDIHLKPDTPFKEVAIIIGKGSITKYTLQYSTNNEWKDLYHETIDPQKQPHSFMGYGFITISLKEQIQTNLLRLKIEESNGKPSVYSIRLK